MVNGYTFRGSNSTSLIFASLLNMGQLLKKEFAPSEQIFSFKSRTHLEGFLSSGSKLEITEVFFCKNMGGVKESNVMVLSEAVLYYIICIMKILKNRSMVLQKIKKFCWNVIIRSSPDLKL